MEFWRVRHSTVPKQVRCYLWSPSETSRDGGEEEEFKKLIMTLVSASVQVVATVAAVVAHAVLPTGSVKVI